MRKMILLILVTCLMATPLLLMGSDCGQSNFMRSVKLLEKGIYSGITVDGMELMVISDQDHFIKIYEWIHEPVYPKPSVPCIDFNTHMVLAAFWGQKPTAGYGISFEKNAKISDDTLKVRVTMTVPPEDALVAQVITSPYALAIVEKKDYSRVEFADEKYRTLKILDTGTDQKSKFNENNL